MVQPAISLCMIVRNEAQMLPDFLRHAQDLWDELCVVDTGSEDETCQLLQQAGAKIARRDWQNDFAAARNASLDLATSDWIVFLDADEMVSSELIQQIRDTACDPSVGAASFRMVNRLPHGRVRQAPLLRMFRRDEQIRFHYAIHEDISASVRKYLDDNNKRLVHLTGSVDHLGYVRSRAAAVEKHSRDRTILEACIKEHPDDLYSRHKLLELARFWSDMPLWKQAAVDLFEWLEDHDAVVLADKHFPGEMIALLARGLYSQDLPQALQVMNRWPQSSCPIFLMARGEMYEQIGDLRKACQDFEHCLNLTQVRDAQYTTVRPLMGLSRLAMLAGAYKRAAQLAEKALVHNPRDPEALFAAISMLRLLSDPLANKKFLKRYQNRYGDTAELHQALGDDALANGDTDAAVSELQRAYRDLNTNDRVGLRLAQAYLANDQIEQATNLAKDISKRLPEAALGLLLCDLVEDKNSDLQIELDLESCNQALQSWLEVIRLSPKKQVVTRLKRNAKAVNHVFPWLPGFLESI